MNCPSLLMSCTNYSTQLCWTSSKCLSGLLADWLRPSTISFDLIDPDCRGHKRPTFVSERWWLAVHSGYYDQCHPRYHISSTTDSLHTDAAHSQRPAAAAAVSLLSVCRTLLITVVPPMCRLFTLHSKSSLTQKDRATCCITRCLHAESSL